MKKVLSFFAALVLSLTLLNSTQLPALAKPKGAEPGGQNSSYLTPNTHIAVKQAKNLTALGSKDYVIVSSATSLVAKADDFSSFKKYMAGATRSVYLMTKADALKFQAANTSVEIETLKTVNAVGTQNPTPSWGLDRLDSATTLDSAYTYDTTGEGVKAYVVDTGINTTNTDFTGRIASGYTYFNDGYGVNDCNGHGTHVAGTIAGTTYGVAKSATVIPVKVLNCSGSGTNLSVVAGINWIVSTHTGGPAVINLSVGGSFDSSINNAVLNATNAGFVVVVAAGNETADACTKSPASAATAITVSAVDSTNTFASFSNYGTCVDIAAPGVSIKSDYINSTTATATLSGTSMASPHVAGVVARLLQTNPARTPAQIASDLNSLSIKGSLKNVPSGTANSLVNLQVSAVLAPEVAPETPAPTITKGASNLAAKVTVPTGTARPTEYTFTVMRNGVKWSTSTVSVAATTSSVTYTSPKIAKRSGTYVVQVTARNGAGTSPTFVSANYKY